MYIQTLKNSMENKSVISVDIFDTLISRKTATPKGIFSLVEFLAFQVEGWKVPQGFTELRIECENICRQIHAPLEITLEQIYEKILEKSDAESAKFNTKLKFLELACELKNVYPIESVCDVVNEFSKSKKIVLLSDMYLPTDIIISMLENSCSDIANFPLLLSSESGKSKNRGDLYGTLLSFTSVNAGEVLHVGDNKYSDIKMAKEAGIDPFHVDWVGLDPFEKKLFDAHMAISSDLRHRVLGELVVGAIRECRLKSANTDVENTIPYHLGYQTAGPILFFYVLWVLRQARKEAINTIYFVARDGQVLLEIARIICRRFNWSFDLKYIYGSRQSWHLPSMTDITETELSWILQGLPNLTLGMVASRVELDPQYLADRFRAYTSQTVDVSKNLNQAEIKCLAEVLKQKDVKEAVLQRALSARDFFLKYLEQEGVLDHPNICMVDLGWQGRLQDSLHKVINISSTKKILGFYFGLIKDNSDLNNSKKAFFFSPSSTRERYKAGRSFINLSEIFCSADHGTNLGFFEQNGVILPKLKEPVNQDAVDWGLADLRKGVHQFAESLSDDIVNAIDEFEEPAKMVVELIIRHLRFEPSTDDASKIGDFIFSGDQREENLRKFAPKFDHTDVIKYLRVKTPAEKSYMTSWIEGTIARSNEQVKNLLTPDYTEKFNKIQMKRPPDMVQFSENQNQNANSLESVVTSLSKLIEQIGNDPTGGKNHKDLESEISRLVDFADLLLVETTNQAHRGPFERSCQIHLDETDLIFHMFETQNNRTMIDVGGHFGSSSYKFAQKDWKVFAFEPDPENRKKFIEKLGHKKNVTLDIRAVGEKPEKGRVFYASEESTGISGMLAFRDTHKEIAKVDVTTVAEIIKKNRIDHIDFLKIDVEGYDFGVLKGVPWDTMKPDVIECEFEDEKTKHLGHTWRDICEYLVERGYTVYVSEWHPIIRYGIPHDWHSLKQYPCELADDMAWGNLLAFRKDPGSQKICNALDKVLKVHNPKAFSHEPSGAKLQPGPGKVVVLPPVESVGDYLDFIARAAWFVPGTGIHSLDILLGKKNLVDTDWQLPAQFDPAISQRFKRLNPLVQLTLATTNKDIFKAVEKADIVLFRDDNAYKRWQAKSRRRSKLSGKRLWQVDPLRNKGEGSNFLQAGFSLLKNKQEIIASHKAKFLNFYKDIGKKQRAFVLATGPSVENYRSINFGDSFKVVCNSIIKDDALMNHVQPDVVVFGDPIFHFGPSRYAGEFRKALLRAAQTHDFKIIIPLRYHGQFINSLPQLEERTIAVPFEHDFDTNLNLASEFYTKTTDNILTLLMLPVAATFADEIIFLGCDGRPPKENKTFWKHSSSVQFNDEMDNIRGVHPGFFAMDYDNYYRSHCERLEQMFQIGESNRKCFFNLGGSYIPALAQRNVFHINSYNEKFTRIKQLALPKRIVIIDPDTSVRVGHFGAYRKNLSEMARKLAMPVDLICHVETDRTDREGFSIVLPLLTIPTYVIGNDLSGDQNLKAEAELEMAMEIHNGMISGASAVYYMYCGAFEYLETFANFIASTPHVKAHVNLFYEAVHHGRRKRAARLPEMKRVLNYCKSMPERMKITVPSREASIELMTETGFELAEAANPSTTFSDDMANQLLIASRQAEEAEGQAKRAKLRVLLPMLPSNEKGYQIGLDVAESLTKYDTFDATIRYVPERDASGRWKSQVDALRGKVEIIEGTMGAPAFCDMVQDCDVMVLPYNPDNFKTRPSGLLIDALYAGKPVITTRGSWLGNRVEALDFGCALKKVTSLTVKKALDDVRGNYSFYAQNAKLAGKIHQNSNMWLNLAASIILLDQ